MARCDNRVEMAGDQRIHADIGPDQAGVDVNGLRRNQSGELALPHDTREDPAKDFFAPALTDARQKGGSTATSTLRSLISGKHLRCAVLDVDRYGRLVAQCLLPNGQDIAAEMIRSGAATEYCRFSGGYYGTC
jgi:hypothetical protein